MSKNDKKKEQFNLKKIIDSWKSDSAKLDKKDWIIMSLLVIFYLIIAFHNLGTLVSPKTYYKFNSVGEEVGIEIPGVSQDISIIRYYTGPEIGSFKVIASTDGKTYKEIATLEEKSVFAWEDLNIDNSINIDGYIDITPILDLRFWSFS